MMIFSIVVGDVRVLRREVMENGVERGSRARKSSGGMGTRKRMEEEGGGQEE